MLLQIHVSKTPCFVGVIGHCELHQLWRKSLCLISWWDFIAAWELDKGKRGKTSQNHELIKAFWLVRHINASWLFQTTFNNERDQNNKDKNDVKQTAKFLRPLLLKSALAARANAAVWEGPSARIHNTPPNCSTSTPKNEDKYWHTARIGQTILSEQLEKQQRVYGNSLVKSNFFWKATQRKG